MHPTLPKSSRKKDNRLKDAIRKAIESKRYRRQPFDTYRSFIQNHYDGFAGELTGLSGILSGHAVLAGQVFKPRAFDVRGCKRILDAGCGNGRYSRYILRRADPDALIAGFDLSQSMLKRARRRLHSPRVHHVAADLTRLPYPDGYFDAAVCGWVLAGPARVGPRLALRRQDAAHDHGGHADRLDVQRHVALPNLQSRGAGARQRIVRPGMAAASVLHQPAPPLPPRRHHRRAAPAVKARWRANQC
jgi:SAM-dependent methyltransferase